MLVTIALAVAATLVVAGVLGAVFIRALRRFVLSFWPH